MLAIIGTVGGFMLGYLLCTFVTAGKIADLEQEVQNLKKVRCDEDDQSRVGKGK